MAKKTQNKRTSKGGDPVRKSLGKLAKKAAEAKKRRSSAGKK